MSKIKERLSNSKVWVAISGIITSVGVIGKINEAPAIADAVETVGHGVVVGLTTNDWTMLAGAVMATVFGFFKKDKNGDKKN